MLNAEESIYYGKQLVLQELGEDAQSKLKDSHVLVAGAGGLGCPALLYLAGAGVGNITIADADVVQLNNLHRQIIYSIEDIGRKKVEAAAERLRKLNPHITINSIPYHITVKNADELLKNVDIVIDATDNFETRFMLGELTAQEQIPLVFAAIFGFEGQLTVFNYHLGPSFSHLFPIKPDQTAIPDCATNGVIGFVPGIMGCLQAAETVKIITGIGTVMSGKLMVLDLLSMAKKELIIKQNAYATHTPKNIFNETHKNVKNMIDEITAIELKRRMDSSNDDLFLLDVREPIEFDQYNIGGTLIPLGRLAGRLSEIPSDKDIVVVCRSGSRSMKAAQFIAESHTTSKVFNLKGGLLAWVDKEK